MKARATKLTVLIADRRCDSLHFIQLGDLRPTSLMSKEGMRVRFGKFYIFENFTSVTSQVTRKVFLAVYDDYN